MGAGGVDRLRNIRKGTLLDAEEARLIRRLLRRTVTGPHVVETDTGWHIGGEGGEQVYPCIIQSYAATNGSGVGHATDPSTQWTYQGIRAEKTGAGYTDHGGAGTGWVATTGMSAETLYNGCEDLNKNVVAGSGLTMGNGVAIDDLILGQCYPLPIPVGALVWVRHRNGPSGMERWFHQCNEVLECSGGGPSCCPCRDCEDATPNATVTVTGSCSGGSCTAVAGSYTFGSYSEGETECSWSLDHPSGYILGITFKKDTGKWITDILSAFDCYQNTDTDGIECVDGTLSGSFTIPGVNGSCGDCTGCTANVTLT